MMKHLLLVRIIGSVARLINLKSSSLYTTWVTHIRWNRCLRVCNCVEIAIWSTMILDLKLIWVLRPRLLLNSLHVILLCDVVIIIVMSSHIGVPFLRHKLSIGFWVAVCSQEHVFLAILWRLQLLLLYILGALWDPHHITCQQIWLLRSCYIDSVWWNSIRSNPT